MSRCAKRNDQAPVELHPSLMEFEELFEECIATERTIMQTKGLEYAMPGQHKLANFQRVATDLKHRGIDVVDAIWVYGRKHLDSILTYIQTRQDGAEPIEGRIYDFRNYLLLLAYAIQISREHGSPDFATISTTPPAPVDVKYSEHKAQADEAPCSHCQCQSS